MYYIININIIIWEIVMLRLCNFFKWYIMVDKNLGIWFFLGKLLSCGGMFFGVLDCNCVLLK